jgi:predicted dehydrogenase
MATDPYSVAIVGTGNVAGGFDRNRSGVGQDAVFTHAKAFGLDRRFRVVACVDPDRDARERFMADWGLSDGYADLAEWRAAGASADVVSLCAPDATHGALLDELAEMPVRAAFAEKPLAASVDEGRAVVRKWRDAGKILAVNYLRRWAPGIVVLRDALRNGEWGRIDSMTVFYGKGLLHNGSHYVDLAHFLFGGLAVEAVTGRRDGYNAADPTVDAVLRAESGVRVNLLGCPHDSYRIAEVRIVTDRGVVDLENSAFSLRHREAADDPVFKGFRALPRGDWSPSGIERAMVSAVDDIAAALEGGTEVASSGASALQTLETCHRILASAEGVSTAKGETG